MALCVGPCLPARSSGASRNGARSSRRRAAGLWRGAHDAQAGTPNGIAVSTDGSGQYSIQGLAAARYFVQVRPPFPNPQHYTGMTYAGIPSNDLCGARGTEVAVGSGTTSGIDFSIAVGASIQGNVTRVGTGEASVDSIISAYDLRGCEMGAVAPEANGAFEFPGLPIGKYYLATRSSTRADQLYPNLPCVNLGCDIFAGTPVDTGALVNFVLDAGSSIAGTILGPGASPLPGVQVEAWKGTSRVSSIVSPDGHFSLSGFSPGAGYRILARKVGFVTEVYPNAPCPGGGCNVGSAGTGIDLPAPGTALRGSIFSSPRPFDSGIAFSRLRRRGASLRQYRPRGPGVGQRELQRARSSGRQLRGSRGDGRGAYRAVQQSPVPGEPGVSRRLGHGERGRPHRNQLLTHRSDSSPRDGAQRGRRSDRRRSDRDSRCGWHRDERSGEFRGRILDHFDGGSAFRHLLRAHATAPPHSSIHRQALERPAVRCNLYSDQAARWWCRCRSTHRRSTSCCHSPASTSSPSRPAVFRLAKRADESRPVF